MLRLSRILFPALLILLVQCRKGPDYIGTSDPDPTHVVPTAEPITANIQGNIVDENNQPASAVQVKVGSQSALTDQKGYFRIDNASLDKKNALVTATKDGYFKVFRLFSANAGTNQVKIKLIKKELSGTIQASTGGTISLSNGSSVKLPANGIVKDEDGSAYSGTVLVYAAYINPANTDISQVVPGSFSAIDKQGRTMVLTSYGMLAVELYSQSGEKLQLKEGFPATLTTTIPAAAQASAPATLPLWYLDESVGIWREEGSATKQGNKYVGEVSHFTFWNCDFGNLAVYLSMTVLNSNSQPMVNTEVRVSRPGSSWLTTASGYTDSQGHITGIVPSNESLLVEVLDACGNIAFSTNAGPLTQNTDLGNVILSSSTQAVVTVRGKLVSCSNEPVSDGYAIINFDNQIRYASTDANGDYTASFMYCPSSPSSAEVTAVDNGHGTQQVSTAVVNITAPYTELTDIVTCGDSPFEYLNYSIDGTNYYWTRAMSFNWFGQQNINGLTSFQVDNLGMGGLYRVWTAFVAGQGLGTFPIESISATDMITTSNILTYTGQPTFTFTKYAASYPDYFEGSFTVQYYFQDSPSVLHSMNGTFKIQHHF